MLAEKRYPFSELGIPKEEQHLAFIPEHIRVSEEAAELLEAEGADWRLLVVRNLQGIDLRNNNWNRYNFSSGSIYIMQWVNYNCVTVHVSMDFPGVGYDDGVW